MRDTEQKIYKKTYKYKSVRRTYNMWDKKECVLGIEELVEIVNQIGIEVTRSSLKEY
jgi:hypothetical protein